MDPPSLLPPAPNFCGEAQHQSAKPPPKCQNSGSRKEVCVVWVLFLRRCLSQNPPPPSQPNKRGAFSGLDTRIAPQEKPNSFITWWVAHRSWWALKCPKLIFSPESKAGPSDTNCDRATSNGRSGSRLEGTRFAHLVADVVFSGGMTALTRLFVLK